MECLCKSLLIRECEGYDVNTNQVLRGNSKKYFFNDLGLNFIYGYDISNNMDAVLKNLIWIELKKRGYDVYSGINGDKKFDFVAIRSQKVMCIQVVNFLEDGNSINKEVEKLQTSNPSHKRYLLSLDKDTHFRKGVIHKNIIDFLFDDINDIQNEEKYESWIAID